MFEISAHGILLDIEGTTSSIRFVVDKMFPFVRQNLVGYLHQHGDDRAVQAILLQIQAEARGMGFTEEGTDLETQCSAVYFLMDRDAKTTGLKQLQGLIWENGFHSRQLVAHVYDEVPDCLRRWRDQGCELRIYSSGSVAAQKLFFGHTSSGNLLPWFTAHYDTTIGGKKETASYKKIADDFGLPPGQIVFISDIVEELAAASAAGLQCLLSVRPENLPQPEGHPFRSIRTFNDLKIVP